MANKVEWLHGAGAWLLTYGIHSTVLLLSVWILTLLPWLRSDVLKEGLWKFALLGGIVTATLQTFTGITPLGGDIRMSLFPLEEVVEEGTVDQEEEVFLIQEPHVLETIEVKQPYLLLSAPDSPSYYTVAGSPAVVEEDTGKEEPEIIGAAETGEPERGSSIPWTWYEVLIGSCLYLSLVTVAFLGLKRFRFSLALARRRDLEHSPLPAVLERLCRHTGMTKPVRLTLSECTTVPMALGIFKPEICLPAQALSRLKLAELESMIAHELAHLVRRDPLWLMLSHLVVRLFFFQPLNRLARNRWQELAEYRCDAWAAKHTGNGLNLAKCLTEVAGWLVKAKPRPEMAMAHGIARKGSSLSRRVTRLLNRYDHRREGACRTVLSIMVVTMLLSTTTAVPGVTLGAGPCEEEVVIALDIPVRGLDPAVKGALRSLEEELKSLEKEIAALRGVVEDAEFKAELEDLLRVAEARARALSRQRCRLDAIIRSAGSWAQPDEPLITILEDEE
jgi:beta-lactamase regulating signal transducer with metallopeptidase domain